MEHQLVFLLEHYYLSIKMERIVYIDYLRNFANLVRCFIHASVPYMITDAPMWPVNEKGSWFFDFTIFELHLFVMELFFMISGFMFAMELNNKSTRKIIKNRFKRIVIPFIFGLVLVVPIVLSMFTISNYSGLTLLQIDVLKHSYFSGWSLGFENFFPTAHLWFLYYLIIFYALTIFLRKILLKIKFFSIVYLFAGIFVSITCMFFMNRWIVDNPITLVPDPPSFIHYFCFFLIGFFVYKSEKLLLSLKTHANKILMIGIVFGVFSIIPQLWFTKTDLPYYIYIKSLAIILSCSAIYFLTIGIWGYFSKLQIKDSKILRYLTDSSYWVYLSNMPFVVIFHILFIPLDIPIYVKFIFSFIGALTLSFLTYEFLVRYTFIGGILNKRRFRNRK